MISLSETLHPYGSTLPIYIAGDIFNKPDNPAELVNMIIENFKDAHIWSIPGQHDLPYHNKEDIHKSSYGILEQAGSVLTLNYRGEYRSIPLDEDDVTRCGMYVCGFPWEHGNYPCADEEMQDNLDHYKDKIKIAVVHEYVGMKGKTYDGKDKSLNNVDRISEWFEGFDIVICGDNHKHFMYQKNKKSPLIYNCGGFIPRNSDEKGNRSYVGIIYSDKTMSARKMSMNFQDKWKKGIEKDKLKINNTDDLIDAIRKAQGKAIKDHETFLKIVEEAIQDSNRDLDSGSLQAIKEIILQSEVE